VAFAPDYGTGVITLKPEFFAEVNDNGPVTLAFHLWSGEQVTYRVARAGSAVTGVAG
jgi:endoglucanase